MFGFIYPYYYSNKNTINVCHITSYQTSDYISQRIALSTFTNASWVVLSTIEKEIKGKIEKFGTPLRDWDINIYRGILTGYNEAFIIDKQTRDRLLATSPESAEIIRPILRGRDIQKYKTEWSDLYLLFIPWHFPLHNESKIKGASTDAEKAFKKNYAEIYNYLIDHKKALSKRNQSETGVRYEWYALQRFGSNYMEDFSKPKIVWKRIGSVIRFSYDETESFCLDSTCFATGEEIKFLVGYLNSMLAKRELLQNAPKTGTGDVIISVQALEVLKVPHGKSELRKVIISLVEECLQKLQLNNNADISLLEEKIDQIIFLMFELTSDEIEFIRNGKSNT